MDETWSPPKTKQEFMERILMNWSNSSGEYEKESEKSIREYDAKLADLYKVWIDAYDAMSEHVRANYEWKKAPDASD